MKNNNQPTAERRPARLSLDQMIENVLPESCILYKCNETWTFYKNEDHFVEDNPMEDQGYNESFFDFILRVIVRLMEDEKQGPDWLVATDWMANGGNPYYLPK